MLTDGTTAIVAVIQDSKMYVGNGKFGAINTVLTERVLGISLAIFFTSCTAGDSRAILIKRGGKVKVMSIDHRPDRYDAFYASLIIQL